MSRALEKHRDCQLDVPLARDNGQPCERMLQIAPMMDVTYKDFRQFIRLITQRAQLWTEMVVADTLLFASREGRSLGPFLDFGMNEHPIVCQLGGSEPTKLADASQIVERWGYDEINLNVGCPSDRVSGKGEFGASLMKRPELVRDCIHAMSRAVQIPVTVKTRLGVDDLDSPEFSAHFVRTVAQSGCKHFTIHSRKAWLQGLSPAQNRSVPPLLYDRVVKLCKEFPDLIFSLNGGVTSLEHAQGIFAAAPSNLAGVMMGRAALDNPCMLWDVDRAIYGQQRSSHNDHSPSVTRRSLADAYATYLDEEHPADETNSPHLSAHLALKPILGLLAGNRGNKLFRRTIEMTLHDKDARARGPAETLRSAVRVISERHPGVMDMPLELSGSAHVLDEWLSPVASNASIEAEMLRKSCQEDVEPVETSKLLLETPDHGIV